MSDNKKVNKLLGEVSKKYGISKEQLESAAQSGNIENLLKNTNPNQSKQIESVLSDPEKAKKLLGHKIILAYILVNTIDEFRGMNPKDVVKYIEGEPHINVVPIDPGVTNTSEKTETESRKDRKITEQVIGLNTENSEINEGMVRFDIIFYVRMKNGLNQIIINIEAQKEEPSKYKILNRAVFYICRIISSQKGRDFVKSEYNKMKKVYSIWICMNMKENSLTHIHLSEDDIIGSNYSQIADGSIVENGLINLREVEIGGEDGLVLHNVEATVALNQNAPILLGNDVLDELASVKVDNVNKTINFTRY